MKPALSSATYGSFMANLAPILKQLRALPLDEWQQVQTKMSAFNSLGGSSRVALSRGPVLNDDYLLEGTYFELQRRGLLGAGKRLPKALLPTGYANRSLEVRGHFEKYLPNMKLPPERIALGRLAARALAEYLEVRKILIAPRTLLNNVDKMVVAVDAAYPGYLTAGLLSFCWQR